MSIKHAHCLDMLRRYDRFHNLKSGKL